MLTKKEHSYSYSLNPVTEAVLEGLSYGTLREIKDNLREVLAVKATGRAAKICSAEDDLNDRIEGRKTMAKILAAVEVKLNSRKEDFGYES